MAINTCSNLQSALAVNGVLSDMYTAAEQAGAKKIAQTGKRSFGPVYGNLAGAADSAVAHLLRMRKGEVPGALSHPDIRAPIDLLKGARSVTHAVGANSFAR
ncbi:hypothetical protein [Zoogloea sp.]|uniref:hypothetical protein n=1 Tax=Zoogloea sp. TaxID=49181 RepID=UPI0032208177